MTGATYTLPFPPSVNGMFPGMKRRRLSPRYRTWRKQAGLKLMAQRARPVHGTVVVAVVMKAPDKRERDADNYLKAIQDLLVSNGIIAGDSKSVVRRVSAEWTEAGTPRAEVTITAV